MPKCNHMIGYEDSSLTMDERIYESDLKSIYFEKEKWMEFWHYCPLCGELLIMVEEKSGYSDLYVDGTREGEDN